MAKEDAIREPITWIKALDGATGLPVTPDCASKESHNGVHEIVDGKCTLCGRSLAAEPTETKIPELPEIGE